LRVDPRAVLVTWVRSRNAWPRRFRCLC